MRGSFLRVLPVLAVAGALTGCEVAPVEPDPGMVPTASDVLNPHDLRMMAGGYNAPGQQPAPPANVGDAAAFTSASDFRNVLHRIDPALCGATDSLGQCVANFRTGSAEMTGVSGAMTGSFLDIAERGLQLGPTFQKPQFSIRGQITQNCLNDPTLRGYRYHATAGTMGLCVVTENTLQPPPGQPARTTYEFYDVIATNADVDDGAGGTPDNGFPEAAQRTGLTIPQKPPFTHKLYAWGDYIVIREYWVTSAVHPNGEPNWVAGRKYKPNDPGLPPDVARLFQPSDEACMDMLFVGAPPPNLDGYTGGVNYCLGRCKNPPVVNTM